MFLPNVIGNQKGEIKWTCQGVSCNYTYVIWYALYLYTVTFIKITSGLQLFHNYAIIWVGHLHIGQKHFSLLILLDDGHD